MDLQIKDKTALVTGSTKGIGLAIATGLAREGARVIINGRTEATVAPAAAAILAAVPDAKLETFAGDLAQPGPTDALVAQFPRVDILVNNLGIFEPKPFVQIPDADWRRFFEVNVLSGVRLSRARIRQLNAACAVSFLAYRAGSAPEDRPAGRTLEEDLAWTRMALERAGFG